MHAKKIISYLSDLDALDSNCNLNISDYVIKNSDVLQLKLSNRLPVPFIISENKECLFMIKMRKPFILYLKHLCKCR